MGIHEEKIDSVPQFVSYFVPLVEIMRDLGGQAKPRQIFDEVIKRHDIPESYLALTDKNGGSKFENRVHFARFYLSKAGMLTSPRRGIWELTDLGWKAELSQDWAVGIFRTARVAFSGDEDEQTAPVDELVPAGVNHWFVGATWGDIDQTERFPA